MNTIKQFCACITAALLCNTVSAQDPALSQYFTSPVTLNPALIGKQVNSWRLAANYRLQSWGEGTQPFTTYTVSAEKNLSEGKKESLALGGMFLSDASNGGLLKRNYFTAGIAYHNALDAEGRQLLSGGLTLTYASRMLDASKFVFQSQLGNGGYLPSIPANETIAGGSSSYVDVNAGLHYSVQSEKSGYQIGVGYFHAAKPKEKIYTGTAYTVNPRLTIQGGYTFGGENDDQFVLSALYETQEGKRNLFTAGALYRALLSSDKTATHAINALSIGLMNRFGSAIYPYLGIEGRAGWLFGLSYDIVTSRASYTLDALTSLELSFVWQLPGHNKSGSVPVKPISY